ncbi:MAG: amidophosphoribosyltransferase [Thermoplasmatota archaeon]
MGDIKEKCGVCAADTPGRKVAYDIYQMMVDLQHRGQAGAGLTTYDANRPIILRTIKGQGRVSEVFGGTIQEEFESIMGRFSGSKGIGHNRYGTSGSLTSRHVQPFERVHGVKHKWFSFGFNGHIANRGQLDMKVREMGFHLMLDTDTELLMHLISKHISDSSGEDPPEVFRRLSDQLDGAFNITMIDARGRLTAIRDPWGIRPLSSVVTENGAYVASETCALHRLGTYDIRHLEPGEMAVLEDGEISYERYADPKRKSLCFFEYIYFAHVTSEIDGKPVYETRKRCGQELARIETQNINEKDWVIIPVPNTARPIAKAYAREIGFPGIYDEGLIASGKGRTFIDEGDRSKKVMMKFLPIPSILRGKKVVVIDDSIVRSTTMATIVSYHLKKIGGAREVHVRIATPPIIAPCYYGIDMRTFEELIAAPYGERIEEGVMDDEVQALFAEKLGADSLIYQTHRGMINALGMNEDEICMACLNREYPTPHGRVLDEAAYSSWIRTGKTDCRIDSACGSLEN